MALMIVTTMIPKGGFADSVLEAHNLSKYDAIEVHGVRADGDVVEIGNVARERFSTYFRATTCEPVRCGDSTRGGLPWKTRLDSQVDTTFP